MPPAFESRGRAILIYNPAAGRGRAARRVAGLLEILGSGGWRVEARPTAAPGGATELAAAAVDEGRDAVFAFGGDGTLREAAAALVGTPCALGFLPGGTVNVMRRVLGLPASAELAARVMADAAPADLDVGLCADEPFLMQASAGLDAAILARYSPRLKRLLLQGAVVPAGLSAWWSYRYPEIELTADGRALSGSFVAVCNISYYGGGFRMAPDARPDDRRLDLVLYRGTGRRPTLGFARDLFLGRHLRRRDVTKLRVEQVSLRAPAALPVQIDGDVTPLAPPLEIRLAPARLRVLVPGGALPGQKSR